jgi:hypothetical protein
MKTSPVDRPSKANAPLTGELKSPLCDLCDLCVKFFFGLPGEAIRSSI